MKIFRFGLLLLALCFSVGSMAQVNKWQDIYKVKKKDTLFGITKKYGITLPELMDANPVMKTQGYELKKGDTIFIPFAKPKEEQRQKPIQPSSFSRWNSPSWAGLCPPHLATARHGGRSASFTIPRKKKSGSACPTASGNC